MDSRRKNTTLIAVIGIMVVMMIMVLGTLWIGQSAKRDTEEAVRAVSLLYLDELAGRREQVVADNLQGRLADLETALALMTEEDLSDAEHLQAYQAKMKSFFGLEKFAFVADDGLIYTALGVRTDIDEYSFDYHSLAGPEISIKDLGTADKTVNYKKLNMFNWGHSV